MWGIGFLILAILSYVITANIKKGQQKRKEKQEIEMRKEKMLSDINTKIIVESLYDYITNLKETAVKQMRMGKKLYFIFEPNTVSYVYYETENGIEKGIRMEILNLAEMGKNPLKSKEEVKVLEEILSNMLKEVPWICVENKGRLILSKSSQIDIPEISFFD